MADEDTTAAAPVDAAAPAETSTEPETTEATTTNGDAAASKEQETVATGHEATSDPATDAPAADEAGIASAEPTPASTPASGSKDKKRKSTGGGVPEHKGKKLNKKKSMPDLNLNCKPGEHYWARLKGYSPWPAIICDESMLPEALLASRPVSTARPDGSFREDFEEGGKSVRDRTFPIMFLSTNEFQWMNNTFLKPLNPEDCKNPKGRMTKALLDAYRIASEDHELDYFKGILKQWQEEEIAARNAEAAYEAERLREEAEAAAAPKESGEDVKPKKKVARKSKGADEDVEMEDADAAPKSSKKRKKAEESDPDAPKAKKTPKVMKLNAPKTPSEASAKKSSKPKKKVVTAPKAEPEDESKPQLTEEEKLAQREKAVLYLRHRLQKGFLSREQAPKESEMGAMDEFFTQLEGYDSLEPPIIRTTKIHKVLKAIVKLATVPKDEEYNFKKRSLALLDIWNKRMESEGGASAPDAAEAKSEAPEEKSAPAEEKAAEEKAPETNGTKDVEAAVPEAQDTEMKDAGETKEGAEDKADDAAEKTEEKLEGKTDTVDDLPTRPAENVAELAEAAKDDADEAAIETATEGETAAA
ncbi:unnamed protein product [Zymoseptoria tritici ST99CH_1E4]|uniref:PWWP domain-containing protein n=1 Tax=Zymoseptoria tritici ST99CH_1E4 TaxID=1276532 RepID=A0A2H1GCU5_ZYMTR|nr:unnamed protein product [Zymoseptoria tritici ST99CH_1E4]